MEVYLVIVFKLLLVQGRFGKVKVYLKHSLSDVFLKDEAKVLQRLSRRTTATPVNLLLPPCSHPGLYEHRHVGKLTTKRKPVESSPLPSLTKDNNCLDSQW